MECIDVSDNVTSLVWFAFDLISGNPSWYTEEFFTLPVLEIELKVDCCFDCCSDSIMIYFVQVIIICFYISNILWDV